jgi:tRNA(Arg) A34 adenosine deaminase TadA
MTSKQNLYLDSLQSALELAQKAFDEDEVPVGAVVLQEG